MKPQYPAKGTLLATVSPVPCLALPAPGMLVRHSICFSVLVTHWFCGASVPGSLRR